MSSVNAHTRTVTDYGIDPHNPAGQIARDLFMRLGGFLTAVTVGGDADPERSFFGYVEGVQNFNNASAPAATSFVYLDGAANLSGASTTDSTMTDPVRRLLADQLARRSAL